MELLLIRHGLPEKVITEGGPADPTLDARGRRQAELLRDYLVAEEIHAVWTSPMRRARETAEPLAAALGVDVAVHDGIAEWDRHASAYIPLEELKATAPEAWRALMQGEWQGEDDPITFQQTVVAAIESIIEAHPKQRVAVTCHGGVINAYVDHILGTGRPTGFFQPDYTSIHRIMAASSGQRSVRALNEVAHLRGTGLLADRH